MGFHGFTPWRILQCAECQTGIQASSSMPFETRFQNKATGEIHYGFLPFCSTTCILNWFNCDECGHA